MNEYQFDKLIDSQLERYERRLEMIEDEIAAINDLQLASCIDSADNERLQADKLRLQHDHAQTCQTIQFLGQA